MIGVNSRSPKSVWMRDDVQELHISGVQARVYVLCGITVFKASNIINLVLSGFAISKPRLDKK